MGPINLQSGELICDEKSKKQQRISPDFVSRVEANFFTALSFPGDVGTWPLPTIKPRYYVSILAPKNLTILINS
jgi:hypothetical protein